jgi:hypothetical protein
MRPGEMEAYERMHALAVEQMGEDVILRDLVRLYEGVLRDGAPILEFEECAIAYAEEMHRVNPDESGRMMRWRCMVVMRDLLGVTLQ